MHDDEMLVKEKMMIVWACKAKLALKRSEAINVIVHTLIRVFGGNHEAMHVY